MQLAGPLTIEDFERLPGELAYFHELVAIEIVSENDSFKKLLKKVDRYRKRGTTEAWIFDIDSRRALVFCEKRDRILDENAQFQSSLIPGFSIRLGDLFDQL